MRQYSRRHRTGGAARGDSKLGFLTPLSFSLTSNDPHRLNSIVHLGFGITESASVNAQDIKRLQSGVVRITATEGNKTKVGTGFIVKLDPDIAYIVTVAHVVSGDAQPKVQFFTQQDIYVQATVKHSEDGDEVTGLALPTIRGKQNLPSGLTALPLTSGVRFSGAEDIMMIGHPRGAGDWVPLKGRIASRKGRYVTVDANIDESNSDGPIIQHGQVVGLVGGVTRYGRGVTGGSVREYLEGHGITIQEAPPAAVTNVQPPRSETRLEVVDARFIEQDRVNEFKRSWLRETPSGSDPFTGETGEFAPSGILPLLDIKLRNVGKEVAVLHTMEIGVSRKAMRQRPLTLCAPLRPTWEYNLLLDELLNFDKGPEKVVLGLSQVIEPNKADRFTVTVGQTRYLEATYDLTFALRFNKSEILDPGKFSLKIAGPQSCETAWRLNTVRRPTSQSK